MCQKTEFIEALETFIMGGGLQAELPLVALIGRKLPFTKARALFNGRDYLETYVKQAAVIARAGGSQSNIFSYIMKAAEAGDNPFDDLDTGIKVAGFPIAGADTSATTILVSLTHVGYQAAQ